MKETRQKERQTEKERSNERTREREREREMWIKIERLVQRDSARERYG